MSFRTNATRAIGDDVVIPGAFRDSPWRFRSCPVSSRMCTDEIQPRGYEVAECEAARAVRIDRPIARAPDRLTAPRMVVCVRIERREIGAWHIRCGIASRRRGRRSKRDRISHTQHRASP